MFKRRHSTRDTLSARTARSAGQAASEKRRPDADSPMFASLEARCMFSFSWSADEVYLTELVNRARENPVAEGVRLGLDLTAGLTSGELARLVPQEPLALNSMLTVAARLQSLDMAERDFFDHVNPDGHDPTWRAQHQGYAGTAGENIAAGYGSIDEVHAAWLDSLGHRKNVLSLHEDFDASFHYDEFGPGFAFTQIGPFFDYHTQVFGVRTTPTPFILGVVFNDANSDVFYNVGEGMTGVRIDVALQSSPGSVVGTYTTDAAGNYQIAVPAGSYNVTFTNLSNATQYTTTTVVSSVNKKVDARAAQFAVVADDYADDGQYDQAEPATGNEVGEVFINGSIEIAADTDLFHYTAGRTGLTYIIVVTSSGSLDATFSVYSSSQILLGNSVDSGDGSDAMFSLTLVEGLSYFVSVGSTGGATHGDYELSIIPQPDNRFNAATGTRIGVASGANGLLNAALKNPSGEPVLIAQDSNGAWTGVQLDIASGSPDITGDIVTWVDPKDGRSYASARSADGLLLYTNITSNIWTFRNLTQEISGAQIPGTSGQLVVLVGVDQIVRLATLLTNGDMVLFQQTGAGESGGYAWSYVNIAETHLGAQSQTMPAFAGEVVSYVTSWNGLNVAGLDENGDIQVVWWAPGLELWQTNNLSDTTGAPPIVDGLSAYLTPWDGINLSGINAQGEVTVTWWVPGFEGDWLTNNLTQEFSGPALVAETVTSYVSTWGGLNIAGLDESGNVTVYWWAPELTNTGWQITSLSNQISGAPTLVGRLTGHASQTGTLNVFGASDEGHVIRFHWAPGGLWAAQDLSSSAGG